MLARQSDYQIVEPRMKKLVYLIVALGIVSIGLLTGCKQQNESNAPAMEPSTNAPAAPATNGMETPSTNASAQ